MRPRLPNVPGAKTSSSLLTAAHYNRVHVALARLGRPLQLMLPGRRGFALLLDSEVWICVDRSLSNLPIVAWTDFRPGRRVSLRDPVPCRLIYYHAYASVLVRGMLDDVTRILNLRLLRAQRRQSGQILSFPGRPRHLRRQ